MNKSTKQVLAFPYIIWMVGFTVIPLLMVFYYGLTDRSGTFTFANVMAIMAEDHMKALLLSLAYSIIRTIICLLIAYPLAMILRTRNIGTGSFVVFIFILPMWMNFLLRTMAYSVREKRCYQLPSRSSSSAELKYYQHSGCDCVRYGLQLPSVHDPANL